MGCPGGVRAGRALSVHRARHHPAAVSNYAYALDEPLGAWGPQARPDRGPLLSLLNAVDAHGSVSWAGH